MTRLHLLLLTFVLNTIVVAQNRYDVVITEIMADPAPQIGLPNSEWIELKNVSATAIDLKGWRIADASARSGPLPAYLLKPGSLVIICAPGAISALSGFGNTIGVTGFPSLDNAGEILFLETANGMTMHTVNYVSDWYGSDLKKEGGWSLEMIDATSPCTANGNWSASVDPAGGTPGKKNSIAGSRKDENTPQLIRSYTIDSMTVVLVFDEALDSLSGATPSSYTISDGVSILSAVSLRPAFNEVELKLRAALLPNKVYFITADNVADCKGNIIRTNNKIKTAVPTRPHTGDIVINEILFNPRPNGYDYVELYNASDKTFDASALYLGNRNNANTIGSITLLSERPFYIFPGDHVVITENAASLALNYLVRNPRLILATSSFPSYPDDKGTVVLLDQQGVVIEEFSYSDKWHFKLLDNVEGISLERMDPAASAQDAANWHSAASTDGYGTPTYKNSHSFTPLDIATTIGVVPKVFSPDNDGWQDVTAVQYKTDTRGYLANITVFNAAGIAVKALVQNATLGASGYWNWDGLNDKGQRLPIGVYIIYTELFNLQGKRAQFKNTVVLARKMN